MSITDEDLKYMADVIWDDALLPGIDADLGLHQLLSADEHVERAANESDALLERKPKSKTPKPPKSVEKTPAAATSKGKAAIDWKRSVKPTGSSTAATPATKTKADAKGKSKEKAGGKTAKSGVTIGDAGSNRDMAKLPPKQPTSPLSDLYLSSLPDTLVKPKVDGKLSKSIKGASQNKKIPAPEADMLSADDPYGIPTSPESKKPNHEKSALNTKVASPTTSVAKMTSPLGLIPASDKKRLKPQKRVAKRSFLDAPEMPEKEEDVKPAQVKPLQAKPRQVKPPSKAAAKSKKKPPVSKAKSTGKGKEKHQGQEKEEQKKKPAQRPQPTKGIDKVENQEQLTSRSFLVPKSEMDENSPYDIPASVLDMSPAEEISKNLRPHTCKPAIVISSDSETSYSDDDSASFAGDTTVMTTPDHAVENFSQTKPKPLQTVASAVTPSGAEGQMIFVRSMKRPTEEAPTKTTNRPKKLQRQAGVGAMHSVTERTENDATTVSYEVKNSTGRLHNARGPEGLVSEQGSVEQARVQAKRDRSPARADKTDQHTKRPKLDRSLSAYQRHDGADAADGHGQMQLQRSSSKVVQSVAESDPFVGDLDEERPQQSQFTSKLLRSTFEPASDMDQWESSRATSQQPQFSQAASTPCAGRILPVSSKAHTFNVPQGVSAESNQIAREMMQLLQSSHRAESGQGQKTGPVSAKDIWLDETDPYKETTQVMSYVCKTLLRFLKSKEAAIEDVATEYRQRGSAVLTSIKELHGNEKRKFALELEDKRKHSLDMFEEASRGVHKIAASLERVSLVPAINDILADSTLSRLKALQTEVA